MHDKEEQPWWKFGHLWMVIAGPAVVVVASFVTLYLAMSAPDPLLKTDEYRQAHEGKGQRSSSDGGLVPAVQARNHAATGEVPTSVAEPKNP